MCDQGQQQPVTGEHEHRTGMDIHTCTQTHARARAHTHIHTYMVDVPARGLGRRWQTPERRPARAHREVLLLRLSVVVVIWLAQHQHLLPPDCFGCDALRGTGDGVLAASRFPQLHAARLSLPQPAHPVEHPRQTRRPRADGSFESRACVCSSSHERSPDSRRKTSQWWCGCTAP